MNADFHRIKTLEDLDHARNLIAMLPPLDDTVVEHVVVLWVTSDGVILGCGRSAEQARAHAFHRAIETYCVSSSEVPLTEEIDMTWRHSGPLYVRVVDDNAIVGLGELCGNSHISLATVCRALGR